MISTLRKMRLLSDDVEGELRATIAGVLMASWEPHDWTPNASIEAVSYLGTERDADQQFDARTITGPLNAQVRDAYLFARRNFSVPARKRPMRREVPAFSYRAVFEALVNAVAHRDYSMAGSRIRLFLFDDRLELYSPGPLPNSVTIDSMPLRQVTRNELIASLLARCPVEVAGDEVRRAFLMEKRGEGVPLILRESEALSGRRPEYRLIDGAELLLTIWAAPSPHADRS